MPPVPAPVMMCDNAKLVTLRSDRVPVGAPRNLDPSASQESSTTCSPYRSAISRMLSQSGALPIRFGARIALVRSVIIASIRATSML